MKLQIQFQACVLINIESIATHSLQTQLAKWVRPSPTG